MRSSNPHPLRINTGSKIYGASLFSFFSQKKKFLRAASQLDMGKNQSTPSDQDSMNGENDDTWMDEKPVQEGEGSDSDGSSDATFDGKLASENSDDDDSLSHASTVQSPTSDADDQKVREEDARPTTKILTNAIGMLVDSNQKKGERWISAKKVTYTLGPEGQQNEPLIQPFLEKYNFSADLCLLLFLQTKKSGKFYTPKVGDSGRVEFDAVATKEVKDKLMKMLNVKPRALKSAARAFFTQREVHEQVYMALFSTPAERAAAAAGCAMGTPKAGPADAVPAASTPKKVKQNTEPPVRNPRAKQSLLAAFEAEEKRGKSPKKRALADADTVVVAPRNLEATSELGNLEPLVAESGAGPAGPPQKKRTTESLISDVILTIKLNPDAVTTAFTRVCSTWGTSRGADATAATAEAMIAALASDN